MTEYVEICNDEADMKKKIVIRGRSLAKSGDQAVFTPRMVLMEIPFQKEWEKVYELFVSIEDA